MKEFIEKLIGRLEEISVENTCSDCPYKAKCDEVQEHINDETTDLCGATIKALSIEIVNQLAEEYRQDLDKNSQGWISCSERLPEKNGMYLVTQKRYSLDNRRMIGIETDYVQFSCGEWCRARFLEVIAWQPLPTPYQPKGE